MMCTICLKDGHRASSCPRRPGQRLAIALAALLLAGCETPGPRVSVTGDSYCKVYRPLSWEPADTPPTIDGIRRENAKYSRLCGKRS